LFFVNRFPVTFSIFDKKIGTLSKKKKGKLELTAAPTDRANVPNISDQGISPLP